MRESERRMFMFAIDTSAHITRNSITKILHNAVLYALNVHGIDHIGIEEEKSINFALNFLNTKSSFFWRNAIVTMQLRRRNAKKTIVVNQFLSRSTIIAENLYFRLLMSFIVFWSLVSRLNASRVHEYAKLIQTWSSFDQNKQQHSSTPSLVTKLRHFWIYIVERRNAEELYSCAIRWERRGRRMTLIFQESSYGEFVLKLRAGKIIARLPWKSRNESANKLVSERETRNHVGQLLI